MDVVLSLWDMVLHIDRHLQAFVLHYGPWVYGLLFLIIFVETGLVVMPFLPGDSLLFVVGALAGVGMLSLPLALAVLWTAAVMGNQTNYTIGRAIGAKVWGWEQSRWFNKRAFEQAHTFYERYGGVTLIVARFMPFLRTFAPFVAGVAAMTRRKFTFYDVTGGGLWVGSLVGAGYVFGNMPWVQQNFSLIVWLMIMVPGAIAFLGAWRAKRSAAQG